MSALWSQRIAGRDADFDRGSRASARFRHDELLHCTCQTDTERAVFRGGAHRPRTRHGSVAGQDHLQRNDDWAPRIVCAIAADDCSPTEPCGALDLIAIVRTSDPADTYDHPRLGVRRPCRRFLRLGKTRPCEERHCRYQGDPRTIGHGRSLRRRPIAGKCAKTRSRPFDAVLDSSSSARL